MAEKRKVISHSHAENFLKKNRLVVVDGGSRGALFEPFNTVSNELLTVLRFEPDPSANIQISADEIIINKGLWKEEASISLNLAKNPATSSVYPPNKDLLQQFDNKVGYPPRATTKVLEVACIDIDCAVEKENVPPVDFIKLDIHGAEYEAIEGAQESLSTTCVGLLVESWVVEVHRGQKLMFDVEQVLAQHGFFRFGSHQVFSWPRKAVAGLRSKNQVVGEENLYLKICNSPEELKALGQERAMKLGIVSDLFGYTAYALQIFDFMLQNEFLEKDTHQALTHHIISKNRITFKDKFFTAVIDKLQKAQAKRH